MDLLYMPLLDLQQHLKQELLTNPFLELVEPDDEESREPESGEASPRPQNLDRARTVAEAEPKKSGDDDIDWEGVLLDGFETGWAARRGDDREWYEPVTVDSRGPSTPLREQIALLDLSRRAGACWPRSSSATSTRTATWRPRSTRSARRERGARCAPPKSARRRARRCSLRRRRCWRMLASCRASTPPAWARATCGVPAAAAHAAGARGTLAGASSTSASRN
jgi:hypothetical protein